MCILGMISYYQSWVENYLRTIYLFLIELVTRYMYYNRR